MKSKFNPKLYIAALIGTFIIFCVALYSSNYINNKKTQELQATEDKIATDILSLETELDLVAGTSCDTIDSTKLATDLDELSSRLSFMEQQVGTEDQAIFRLKRYYSLLEIKDYLLTQKLISECKNKSIPILYFYSSDKCPTCKTQEYILQAIKNEYPQVKVYYFDYNLDLAAVQTLISLHNIPETPPVLDIQGKLYGPFESLEAMQAIIAPLATTTPNKVKSL